jgi:hypothetical protein
MVTDLNHQQLREEADRVHARLVREGPTDEVKAVSRDLAARVQKKGQRQVEHLCRSLHLLMNEFPETRIAIEGGDIDDKALHQWFLLGVRGTFVVGDDSEPED